ncbi:hypothetical protein [Thermoproteus tenax]|uniref:Uncharacterized protein n=1 Tax=Thermoproteus tenax (strain ATCC 35583 / DSM 2078 / JCM 9277 / NBRC 100435 / Kra 1) TaxID=768679 RepID=G4RK40_THETK|nr:hypothetical protein [Thermoproteus tenax]CCC81935.1 conserved hypothetical protein [Thermoproteus tenax Kra 1]
MECREREVINTLRARLGCEEGGPLDLGFARAVPDMVCNGVPVEVECLSTFYCGVGQALTYLYAVGRAALILVADEVSAGLRRYLEWLSQSVDVYVYSRGEITPLGRARWSL